KRAADRPPPRGPGRPRAIGGGRTREREGAPGGGGPGRRQGAGMAEATAVAAAPVAQMENCQRLSSVEKDTSALHKNIAEKGTNAYYFAHSRSYEIPAHAKIITGPGLVAGGPPQKLDGPDGSPAADHGTAPSPQA
ncbi:unnamed protein product, partial [Prorocentrum cordatum]